MKEILMTLAFAVVLSVLADVLISGGGIKKYARLAIGISVATVLVLPIVKFLATDKTNFDIPSVSDGYITMVDSQYITILENTAEKALKEKGIAAEIQCEICGFEITQAVAICDFALDKNNAEIVGKSLSEVLSLPLAKIVVKESE